jgi:uncharacterized protein HemX
MTAAKNGNGTWLKIALTLAALLVGLGTGWGVKSNAITQNEKAIARLDETVRTDHDCVTQMRTELPLIRQELHEIKSLLQGRERRP